MVINIVQFVLRKQKLLNLREVSIIFIVPILIVKVNQHSRQIILLERRAQMLKDYQEQLLKNLLTGDGLTQEQMYLNYLTNRRNGKAKLALVESLWKTFLQPSKELKILTSPHIYQVWESLLSDKQFRNNYTQFLGKVTMSFEKQLGTNLILVTLKVSGLK